MIWISQAWVLMLGSATMYGKTWMNFLSNQYSKGTAKIYHFLFRESMFFFFSFFHKLLCHCEISCLFLKLKVNSFSCIRKRTYTMILIMQSLNLRFEIFYTLLYFEDWLLSLLYPKKRENLKVKVMKFFATSFKSKAQTTTELMKQDKEAPGIWYLIVVTKSRSSELHFKMFKMLRVKCFTLHEKFWIINM